MRRTICALLLLAACSPAEPPRPLAGQPAACRAGPDGEPIAERGIGGTGAPVQSAERGIGGTGIIGVITGFASICLAGQEVALPPDVPVAIDGAPAVPMALRTGQVAAVSAAGQPGALQARAVLVRHLVVGPVGQVGGGTMTVAGQRVLLDGQAAPALGAWVAVSGLRRADGGITATRIDPAPPGPVLVRGILVRTEGPPRIGGLAVTLPAGTPAGLDGAVIATGVLRDGGLLASQVERDEAAESPSAFFGPSVDTYIVEADVAAVPGGLLIGRDFVAGATAPLPGRRGFGVAAYGRAPGGGFSGLSLPPMGAGFDSAPGFGGSPPGGFGPGSQGPGSGLGGSGLGGSGLGGSGPGGSGPGGFGPGGFGGGQPGVGPGGFHAAPPPGHR